MKYLPFGLKRILDEPVETAVCHFGTDELDAVRSYSPTW